MNRFVLYLNLLFVFFTVFALRLHFETNAMNSKELNQIIDSRKTYQTELIVRTDPVNKYFSTTFIASDSTLDKRVIVSSAESNSSLLLGLRVGDTLVAMGYPTPLNQFQQYKRAEHIVAVFKVDKIYKIISTNSILYKTSQRMRDSVSSGCSKLEEKERGICEGLLIGKKDNIQTKTYETYTSAQMSHLLVASGANIAFLVGFVNPLIKKFRLRSQSTIVILIAIFYCFATRFEPSILRASVMVILPAVLAFKGIDFSKVEIFISTISICLLLDPFLYLRAGFWLSVFATAGIYFVAPILNRVIQFEIVCNTLGATICVQPVLWFYFGSSNPFNWPFGVMAVAIAEPLSTVGLVLIFLSSFLGTADFTNIVIFPVDFGIKLLNSIAIFGASPGGKVVGLGLSCVSILAYTVKVQRNRKTSHGGEK